MANILDLKVTITKRNLKDSYFPKLFPAFSLLRGQKVKYDDDRNELIIKLPGEKAVRRVKMAKSEVEKFTDYHF